MASSRIAIVLVGPKGDANIGACARAMKNFGLTDLRLVDSVPHLTEVAHTWAVGARDVLEKAKVHATLGGALSDASYAVAFTRRIGRLRKRHMAIGEAASWISSRAASGRVALVFGREDAGLTNDEVRRCDATVTIPTSEAFPSLNLAQAVLIVCHELYANQPPSPNPLPPGEREMSNSSPSLLRGEDQGEGDQQFVSRSELAAALARLDRMLAALGYEDSPSSPLRSKIIEQIERIFGRGGLTPRDVGMLEGLAERIISRISTT